ncbi:MAG: hypothetical protein MAG795_01183 [Candidatus Woesearchaeota archaeon]|nr:hypothetical protein [Candidatus Woesearchaeota archaeon]
MTDTVEKCSGCVSCAVRGGHTPWYKERLYVVGIITILLIIASYLIPGLSNLNTAFVDYLKKLWWAVLIGLLIGGIIDHFVPREWISKFLSTHKKRGLLYAVGFGFLMSACSHGILAIAMQLYKKGASIPAVVALLLASPWANLPITILFFSFFGYKAYILIISAIIIAINTGLVFRLLDKKGMIEKNPHTINIKKSFSIKDDFRKKYKDYRFSKKDLYGILKGSWALAKMMAWWILVGMIIASIARVYVPQHYFMKYMGPSLLGLFITLVFATIIEVCSEGSAVLAFELFNQTGAFGNSFTFLLAGVATDYTEIGLIWSTIGKKTAIWVPVITVPQILALSYLFNAFL